ncbi:hypothetical protein CLV88_11910 [Shimia abyssi]|uniref:Uncharacterized protein n=1 Tax=Shimia abyssi TaxID=1662395 RepID=A0A2P8F6A5_9RHOB|nr:hypothetical protein CLV88_11910 [Shimia abyssi]
MLTGIIVTGSWQMCVYSFVCRLAHFDLHDLPKPSANEVYPKARSSALVQVDHERGGIKEII